MLLVTERTFTQEVLESEVPVLVNFEAHWCGLCKIIHPLLFQFQVQCGKEMKLVTINADQNFKLSNTYQLKTLPTLLLIEKGTVKQRLEGFRGKNDLHTALDGIKHSYNIKDYNIKDYSFQALVINRQPLEVGGDKPH